AANKSGPCPLRAASDYLSHRRPASDVAGNKAGSRQLPLGAAVAHSAGGAVEHAGQRG
nr:hypothetical protein [Tanacetum cinerariifolium]